MRTIIIMLMLLSFKAMAADQKADQWFCRDESGKRDANVMWACGVGEGLYENQARAQALREAFKEYHTICEESADCDMKQAVVEPKRLTCVETMQGRMWKCYRLIEIRFPLKD